MKQTNGQRVIDLELIKEWERRPGAILEGLGPYDLVHEVVRIDRRARQVYLRRLTEEERLDYYRRQEKEKNA